MGAGGRVDFSRNAAVFDERHGRIIAEDVRAALVELAGYRPGASILDIGAGTGRVSLGLAASGCHVVAVEPAAGMLAALKQKAEGADVRPVGGEGGHLPFARACFDGVVMSRVLYLMRDWRDALAEATRVLKPDGALLHEWGDGGPDEESSQIRSYTRRLFEDAGVAEPFHPGARTEAQVVEHLGALGWRESASRSFPGTLSMTVGELLRRIESGEFSWTWNVPADVVGPGLAELRRWAADRFGLDHRMLLPRAIWWRVYRRG
jgi:SAM-dependent methyltransferase